MLLLLACEAPVCPEPVVCELAKQDEAELRKTIQWQAGQISRLTMDAMRIEVAKDRCPTPSCHCAPPVRHYKHKYRTSYLGIE